MHLLHPPRRSSFWRGAEAARGGPGGRTESPGGAGSAALGWSRRGAPSRLIPHLQGAARREIIDLPFIDFAWNERWEGVREPVYLCLAYFGEFGNEPKSKKISSCQTSSF